MAFVSIFIGLKSFPQFSWLNGEPVLLVGCDGLALSRLIISFILLAVFQNSLSSEALFSEVISTVSPANGTFPSALVTWLLKLTWENTQAATGAYTEEGPQWHFTDLVGLWFICPEKHKFRNQEFRLNRAHVKLESCVFASLLRGKEEYSTRMSWNLERIWTQVLCFALVWAASDFLARINLLITLE